MTTPTTPTKAPATTSHAAGAFILAALTITGIIVLAFTSHTIPPVLPEIALTLTGGAFALAKAS